MNFMPSGTSSEVKFEIGHVLFIDIVGYSKLLINEQSEQMQTLEKSCAAPSSSAGRSRRQTAALTDRRWWRACVPH